MLTDIVATIGPKSHNQETITKMAEAGMTIVRNNFSHCQPDEYKERVAFVEAAKAATGKELKMLADLQGPRIRVKGVPAIGVTVTPGQTITFVTNGETLLEGEIGVDDPYLHSDVKVGEQILIEGGAIETIITAVEVERHRIHAEVINSGVIYPNKGLNMPSTKLTTSCLTDKDKTDIEFLKTQPFDFVALSFVQEANDVTELRKLFGDREVKVIVKIERQEALKNIDEIIDAADGVMVARGDLAVEMPFFEVPIAQKQIIRKCHLKHKPVIVATQMLLSMVKEPSPTRAEVSDVANAVFDGAHGVMLSDETANGAYPVQAVDTMAKVVSRVEEFLQY